MSAFSVVGLIISFITTVVFVFTLDTSLIGIYVTGVALFAVDFFYIDDLVIQDGL